MKHYSNWQRFQIFLFTFLLKVLTQINEVDNSPAGKVITIHQGDIRGRVSRTRDERLFVQFYGIPYAKTPKRFQLPRPGPKWKGILEASKKPPACFFQHNAADYREGSEDCLFINVHTPQTHDGYYLKKLPVLVQIHGGFNEWYDQTGHYSEAKYFLDEDVVLVNFNYRLGPFGFFTTSDETIPANLGLKDQVLALKWVKKNIEFFGGDSNKITIMGYGAGAASVYYHILSPMSKGLFEKAITQSGNSLCPWAIVDDPDKTFENFIDNLECNKNTSQEVVECLENVSPVRIVKEATAAQSIFSDSRYDVGNTVQFGPVVEHWMRNWPEKPIFLHHYPQNLMANWSNATMSAVPLLIGVNELDGVTAQFAEIIRRSLEPEGSPNPIWNLLHKSKFGMYFGYTNRALNRSAEIDDKVMEYYFKAFGDKEAQGDQGKTFFNALSHRHYFQCTRATALSHSKVADTYLYYFSYFRNVSFLDYWVNREIKDYNLLKDKLTNLNGPVHGDELQYLFDLDEMGDFPLIRKKFREKSLQFSKSLVKMWVNFAGTGKPAPDWQPVPKGQDKGSLKWYEIGDKRMSIDEPFRPHVDFWESLDLDGLRDLPPLRPKNDTNRHRNNTKKDSDEDLMSEDIIYIDQPGDDDGTGGLFRIVN